MWQQKKKEEKMMRVHVIGFLRAFKICFEIKIRLVGNSPGRFKDLQLQCMAFLARSNTRDYTLPLKVPSSTNLQGNQH